MISEIEKNGYLVTRRARRVAPLEIEVEASEELSETQIEVVATLLFRAWKKNIESDLPPAESMEFKKAA